jgi:hypothetical protein
MLTNRRSEAGVKGIMQLAREYDLDTAAEFVESENIARRLHALGIRRGPERELPAALAGAGAPAASRAMPPLNRPSLAAP